MFNLLPPRHISTLPESGLPDLRTTSAPSPSRTPPSRPRASACRRASACDPREAECDQVVVTHDHPARAGLRWCHLLSPLPRWLSRSQPPPSLKLTPTPAKSKMSETMFIAHSPQQLAEVRGQPAAGHYDVAKYDLLFACGLHGLCQVGTALGHVLINPLSINAAQSMSASLRNRPKCCVAAN